MRRSYIENSNDVSIKLVILRTEPRVLFILSKWLSYIASTVLLLALKWMKTQFFTMRSQDNSSLSRTSNSRVQQSTMRMQGKRGKEEKHGWISCPSCILSPSTLVQFLEPLWL